MKRTLFVVLALAMIVAMFAGCSGGAATPSEAPSAAPTAAPSAAPSAAPTAAPTATPTPEPDSPYNYAAGNYETNAAGIPLSRYEYELPISSTDEVISYWYPMQITCIPEMFAELSEQQNCAKMAELTGINIEYTMGAWTAYQTEYSVMLASDDFKDIMWGAEVLHPESMVTAIADKYYVNIADYAEYCPNYIWVVNNSGDDVTNKVYAFGKDTITQFYTVGQFPATSNTGLVARGDWTRSA